MNIVPFIPAVDPSHFGDVTTNTFRPDFAADGGMPHGLLMESMAHQ